MGSHDSIFLDREIEQQEKRANRLKEKIENIFSGKGYGNEMEMERLEWLIENKDKIIRNRRIIDMIG